MPDGKRSYVTVLVYVCINSFQIEKKAVRGTVQNEQKNQDVIWSEKVGKSRIFFPTSLVIGESTKFGNLGNLGKTRKPRTLPSFSDFFRDFRVLYLA